MKNILISVIIPIYNSEEYLEKLLSSLREMINEKIQVILVNDGSTDNSKNIINRYNDIFKVIHLKKNHGVSYARNYGLKYATGKYITFVDSDDSISKDYFKVLLKNIESNHDIYAFELEHVYKDRVNKNTCEYKKLYTKEELFSNNFLKPYVFIWVTNKCIKREVLLRNRISFNIDYSIGEDLDFMLKVLNNIKTIYFIDKTLYYYNRANSNSLTRKKILSLPYDTFICNTKIEEFFIKNKINNKIFSNYKMNIYNYVDNKLRTSNIEESILNKLLKDNYKLNL